MGFQCRSVSPEQAKTALYVRVTTKTLEGGQALGAGPRSISFWMYRPSRITTPRIIQGQRGSPFCGPMQLQAHDSVAGRENDAKAISAAHSALNLVRALLHGLVKLRFRHLCQLRCRQSA